MLTFSWLPRSIILYKELQNVGLFAQVTVQGQNCVTGVVAKGLSQSQILKGIQDKNTAALTDVFDGFRNQMMYYKGELK